MFVAKRESMAARSAADLVGRNAGGMRKLGCLCLGCAPIRVIGDE
jgi:hypothetical protein